MRRLYIYSICYFCAFVGSAGTLLAQDADTTAAVDDAASSQTARQLWDIIVDNKVFSVILFFILLAGVFISALKAYELMQDRRRAAHLHGLDAESMSFHEIVQLVKNESRHMLSEVYATMINVFQTKGTADQLHDEVASFVSNKKDQFSTFRLRVDFLSDTAGAIGLLGTVWGMIIVFNTSSGELDQAKVLAGMGAALITTMLGLVVSLVLNLVVTELHSTFNKRLDIIEDKADVFRFRLMELEDRDVRVESAHLPQTKATSPATTEADSPAQRNVSLEWLEFDKSTATDGTANFRVKAADSGGQGVGAAQITATLLAEDGTKQSQTSITDANGAAGFTFDIRALEGLVTVEASSDRSSASLYESLELSQSHPASATLEGRNQSAPAGEALPNPHVVRVLDESGDPCEGVPVTFVVAAGEGRFADGGQKTEVLTDKNGRAKVSYVVGDEPGINMVKASVQGIEGMFDFPSMGIE